MKRVFIINGPGVSGKDTFIEFCSKVTTYPYFYNISTVDLIKKAATILGCDINSKSNKNRKFLSDLKNLWTRYNDGPFNYIKDTIDNISEGMIFVHSRELEEIRRFKDECNYEFIYVERGFNYEYGNESDDKAYLTKNLATYIVDNTSDLKNLEVEAIKFMLKFNK